MGRSELCNSFIGTTFHAKRWLSVDPCGLCCVTLSFGLHSYALYAISSSLISNSIASQLVFGILYAPAAALALTSLFMAWTTDPGAVPMGAKPLDVDYGEDEDEENPKDTTATGEEGGFVDEERINAGGGATANGDGPVDRETAMSAAGGGGSSAATVTAPGGSPTKKKKKAKRGIRRCRKCNDNYKPPRAHHDSVTGRCIVKMDHYCPWVGNAVGALNHKFFVLFISYTFMTSLISLLLLLIQFIRCGFTVPSGSDSSPPSDDNPSGGNDENDASSPGAEDEAADQQLLLRTLGLAMRSALESGDNYDDDEFLASDRTYKYPECHDLYTFTVLALFIITVLFLLFTCCMLVEQTEAIHENTGKIARMQIRAGRAGDELLRVTKKFNEMFGGDHPQVAWHWFLPIPVKFPDDESRDRVLGYTWDPCCGNSPYREMAPSSPLDVSSGGGADSKDGGTMTSSLSDSHLSSASSVGAGGDGDESSISSIGLTRTDSNVKKRRGT
mmetsp:Transcript_4947/g.6823  ORF Transcript_4947/g.6823 Transcript_4947/m.6823 type:complete len:501 (-) Transcript_4947:355-1857(-)